MAARFDLDAIFEFQPYWYSDMCWWRLALVNRIVFYRVISVYRKTVMIVINGCNRLVTVLNIIMYVQWSPIFSFNRALGKMLRNCRDIIEY